MTDLVRATRVLMLAVPVVNLPEDDEAHIHRLGGYLLAEAKRPRPDTQRIQLLGSLLRSQLQQGPAAATLGAVLADSFDEALNGASQAPAPASTSQYHRARPARSRQGAPRTAGSARGRVVR